MKHSAMDERVHGKRPPSTASFSAVWPEHERRLLHGPRKVGEGWLKNVRGIWKILEAEIGDLEVAGFSRRDAQALVTRLAEERSLKPTTCNRYLAVLSGILNSAVDLEHVPVNPLAKLGDLRAPEERREVDPLAPAQKAKLLEAAPPKARAALLLALDGGLRRSEVLRLRRGNLDLSGLPRAVVERAKNPGGAPKTRVVPLTKRTVQALRPLLKGLRAGDPVFPHLSPETLTKGVPAWSVEAGIGRYTFHGLRHAWATAVAQTGRPTLELMHLGGWSSLDMVQRYADHGPQAAGRQAIAALERAEARALRRRGKRRKKGHARKGTRRRRS